MYEFTKEQLEKIYNNIQDKRLKGKICAILDYDEDMGLIFDDPARKLFVMDNMNMIKNILWYSTIKQDNYIDLRKSFIGRGKMSNHHYHWHYLDIEFNKLIRKSNETWDTEYAYVKLKEDSGMTELKDKKSLDRIWKRLDKNGLKGRIDSIKSDLFKWWLYLNDYQDSSKRERRVSIAINSNKELVILITHDSLKTQSGFSWYYFMLVSDYIDILDFLLKNWYYEDNIWEAISFIIENNKERYEDDGYDIV